MVSQFMQQSLFDDLSASISAMETLKDRNIITNLHENLLFSLCKLSGNIKIIDSLHSSHWYASDIASHELFSPIPLSSRDIILELYILVVQKTQHTRNYSRCFYKIKRAVISHLAPLIPPCWILYLEHNDVFLNTSRWLATREQRKWTVNRNEWTEISKRKWVNKSIA